MYWGWTMLRRIGSGFLVMLFLATIGGPAFSAGIIDKIRPPGGGTLPGTPNPIGPGYRALEGLQSNGGQLYRDQSELIVRLDHAAVVLRTTAKGLAVISGVETSLGKIDRGLTTIDTLARTASAIPQAKDTAAKILHNLEPIKANVKAAHDRLLRIKLKTEPLRQKLQATATGADALKMGLTGINEGVIAPMSRLLPDMRTCLLFTYPAERYMCADGNMVSVSGQVGPVVVEYDRVVKHLLVSPSLPNFGSLLDPLQASLRDIEHLCRDLEALAAQLETLASKLRGLTDVLDRSFSFSFPYPDPTLTNPFHVSHWEVSIGFKTIIQGYESIERAIRSKLSDVLWEVLKGLGVAGFIHDLQNQATNALNFALDQVVRHMVLSMPSLSPLADIENAMAQALAALDTVHLPSVDTNLPNFGLPDVAANMDFKSIIGFKDFYQVNWAARQCAPVAAGCPPR